MNSTKNLIFECLAEAHAVHLYLPFSDERIYTYIPGGRPKSLESLKCEFRRFASGAPADSNEIWLNWAIRHRGDGHYIGTLQATKFADGLLWLGYKLTPTAWGKGYATEALGWLITELRRDFGHHELLAAVDTRNTASIRVLEHCGFKRLRREVAELDGEVTEDYIYAHNSYG